MAINGSDFIDSARSCLEQDDEVGYRSCISRAYYGMFHEAMASLKHVPYYSSDRHRSLISYMTSTAECKQEPYDKHKLKVMGYKLKQMRDSRNEADYDIARVTISKEMADSGIASAETLYTILCKCLFSEVTVQAVTELDNKAAHRHTPVPQRHCPFL